MKEWTKHKFMILRFFIFLFYCCRAQTKSSDNITISLSNSTLSSSTTNIHPLAIETETTVPYVTIYPQRWHLIIGITFASATLLLLTAAAILTFHMRRTRQKLKEIKSTCSHSSIFIRHQHPVASMKLNRLFLRNKQLPVIIEPQLQSAIYHASMIPSSPLSMDD